MSNYENDYSQNLIYLIREETEKKRNLFIAFLRL